MPFLSFKRRQLANELWSFLEELHLKNVAYEEQKKKQGTKRNDLNELLWF